MWREELFRLSPIFHFRWLPAAPTAMHRPTSLRTLFSPLAAALCLASCAAQRPAPRPTPTEALVSAAQLPGELARLAHNAVLLDVRERAAYDEGHVAGALHLPLEEWERASLSEESGLAHDAAWRARIGALGIDGDDTVLVYDSGKMTSAARVWFVLQHFGVARAAVVDGGFPLLAQVAAQGALPLQSAPSVRTPTTFEPASPALVGWSTARRCASPSNAARPRSSTRARPPSSAARTSARTRAAATCPTPSTCRTPNSSTPRADFARPKSCARS